MPQRLPSAPPVLPGLSYVRPLGSGGFADVFLYAQDMPRREVAVKVLPAGVDDPDLLRMFNAEADVLAHLSAHPSIVTVYQAGISADGRPYIVMEYCPGSLARRYRRDPLPVDEALTIGVKMAGALESAHREGLVHRDVKPSNILITAFGAPVLADFGISSSLAPRAGEEVLAMSIPWSAPEVIAGRTAGTVASEVWALGATVYSLLAGHSPFEVDDRARNAHEQLSRRIRRGVYTPIRRDDVPDAVQRVLATAMARDPDDRYASALALAQALRDTQRGMGFRPAPLEVAVDEWVPGERAVDFSDAAPRGAHRSVVEYTSRRRATTASGPLRARDEDSDITGSAFPRTRGVRPWAVALIAAGAVAVAAGIAWALLAGGVI